MKRPIVPYFTSLVSISLVILLLTGCAPSDPVDEAKAAGRTVADFPESTTNVFKGMDDGIELTEDERKGRSTWMLWAGGNEAFWDRIARRGYGVIDLLKTIDSREHRSRFEDKGLFNEPGYRQATMPDQYGLWIDEPIGELPRDISSSVYGLSSGVIGLRLFPNPNFDEAAEQRWDAERYYSDPEYYHDPNLVRPYRVGMTCAICHVAPHPLHPPEDPNSPQWHNLSSTIGNQYWRALGVFGNILKDDDFLYYLLGSARPGTVDTSILATDYNNNPNIINAIFKVEERLTMARNNKVRGGALLVSPRTEVRPVPHVLVDGADSVGLPAAMNRVFVNIGTFSEHWIKCHNPLVGVREQKPFSIELAQRNSVYWQVTEKRMANLAKYLIRAGRAPMRLADAPGGSKYLEQDPAVLEQGKIVFAENCFVCHSSKRPPKAITDPIDSVHQWKQGFKPREEFISWARMEVQKTDFLQDNYLSTDARVPITILGTNASRALQDNAKTGHIWQDFSSDDYKNTPSIGNIEVYNPFSDQATKFEVPAGGPGFYRVPTLIGIWARAPFLHNNALGSYVADPSVGGRMWAFDDAIRKMFWKGKRQGQRTIARTQKRSYLRLDPRFIPVAIEGVLGREDLLVLQRPLLLPLLPLLGAMVLFRFGGRLKKKFSRVTMRVVAILIFLFAVVLFPLNHFAAGRMGALEFGPFPAGTPINLLTNLDPHAPLGEVLFAMLKLKEVLGRIDHEELSDSDGLDLLEKEVGSDLFRLSKSPDWIEDRGHYFAVNLSDSDKEALIAFLKTL